MAGYSRSNKVWWGLRPSRKAAAPWTAERTNRSHTLAGPVSSTHLGGNVQGERDGSALRQRLRRRVVRDGIKHGQTCV